MRKWLSRAILNTSHKTTFCDECPLLEVKRTWTGRSIACLRVRDGHHSRAELFPRLATTFGRQSPEFVVNSRSRLPTRLITESTTARPTRNFRATSCASYRSPPATRIRSDLPLLRLLSIRESAHTNSTRNYTA